MRSLLNLRIFTDDMSNDIHSPGIFIHHDIYAFSDLIIPGLVTNGTAKICCLGLILAPFYSTMVIKNDFG